MHKFELTILGSNSAMPAYGRWPTCQILSIGNELIMLDCGEGAQIRMAQYKVKRTKINHVLISHLHGDHIYGLPGFIGSLSHLSRKMPLYIFGPVGIEEYLQTVLRLSECHLSFELIIQELQSDTLSKFISDEKFTISSFPVSHRIPTLGYLVTESEGERNIRREAISEFNLTIDEIKSVKAGSHILREGRKIQNRDMTKPQPRPRSYAYCADTKLQGWSKDHLVGVDLLYLETTYLDELSGMAEERGHLTAKQAGALAKTLNVNKLVIGHYSSRYKYIDALVHEARQEFPNTIGGMDGSMVAL